eukprot:CAMPEP_0201893858 /NCGR_PEP_ID=MMETSP0902-20130614/39526_1 /ASSEMBLY_ACC=CAM_ASM_000551 /TAXON_ID=420261 /ORGANISM="Thalassiosira antarctica, Strain CCMP982" /LENGTH=545 /DNA_ID=CAMNT_0048425763 /DNA_START=53 /DNA_END=1690 /DNA_ORIENTATION=-
MDVPTSNYCLAFSTITPLAYRPPQFKTRQTSFLPKHQPASWTPFSVQNFGPKTTSLHASPSSSNKTKPPPLPKIDDPFLLLGLDSRNPTTDKKEIKRAYRKRAMQYHPDVILSPDSTKEERDVASKDFARINAAYEMLTGGGKGSVGSSSTSGSGAKSSSGGYKYQPPHRRTSDYTSGKSTNWEDFMPKYDEEDAKYDADGDSIGSIFSDILTGAAGYATGVAGSGGGSGIVGDFIDFLEGNIDGFESGYDDDTLLRYGSFDEVASDMDETDILVTSLETKLSTVENELMQAQADLNVATKYSEKLDFEERVAELKAREKVVKGYLKKGKKRLIKLRERYKELMVEGRGGRGYGGSSSRASAGRSSRSSSGGSSSSSRSNSSSRAPEPAAASSAPSTASSTSSTPSSAPASSSTKSWRNEGFSSSYGGRSSGSTRSSRRNRGAANVDEPSSASTTKEQSNQQQQRPDGNVYSSRSGSSNRGSTNPASKTTTSRSSNKPVPQEYEPWVPPHRRSKSSTEQAAQDKKRLRELKVDDDFDKLKREMGM